VKFRKLELIKLGKFAVVIFFLSLTMVFYNLAHAQQTNRASIKITVTGLKSDDGNVRVSVYNTEQNWLKESVYKSTVIISNKKSEWILENVPYGDYAVTVFHDENSNGDIDTGFMRIPKEPYGFSNNAKASFGPPKWSDAKLYNNISKRRNYCQSRVINIFQGIIS
jgi:uncharacterized protein (DUF2141 family)